MVYNMSKAYVQIRFPFLGGGWGGGGRENASISVK